MELLWFLPLNLITFYRLPSLSDNLDQHFLIDIQRGFFIHVLLNQNIKHNF